jgi:hypothetical protein
VFLTSDSEPDSFIPVQDPDPEFWAEYQFGSGYKALMARNCKKFIAKNN